MKSEIVCVKNGGKKTGPLSPLIYCTTHDFVSIYSSILYFKISSIKSNVTLPGLIAVCLKASSFSFYKPVLWITLFFSFILPRGPFDQFVWLTFILDSLFSESYMIIMLFHKQQRGLELGHDRLRGPLGFRLGTNLKTEQT